MPFALGLVAIFSFEAVDLFFISRLGENALAAVAFCMPVIWLVYSLGIGFEAGAASCVSRAVGRKDAHKANRLTTDTVMLALAFALVVTLAGFVLLEPVFAWLGATENLMPLVRSYMHTWLWVAPLDMALWTSLASIRARGNTAFESKVLIAAALINGLLDPVFIFGLFGFPALGVQGAALATLISNALVLAFCAWHLSFVMGVYASPFAPLTQIIDSWKHVLHIGIPAMITNSIIPVSSAIVVSMIATFGVEAVAGFGVAMRIEPIFLIPFYALSAISSPFFGQNSGAGHFDRLLEARRVLTRFCLWFGLALALILVVVSEPLTGLYSTAEPIQSVAIGYLWVATWSYGAYGVVMSVNAAFNGIGKPLPGVVISTCRVIVVFLPLAFVLRDLLGLSGLFVATLLSNAMMGLVAWAWLGRQINALRSTAPSPSAES